MDVIAVAEGIRQKFKNLLPSMNERVRRHWAATEAMALARGGISVVAAATGMSRNTIRAGIGELKQRRDSHTSLPLSRIRRPGGGGKPLKQTAPHLAAGVGRTGGPGNAGRSDVAVAMDAQEH